MENVTQRTRRNRPNNMREFIPDMTPISHTVRRTEDTWYGLYRSDLNVIEWGTTRFSSPSGFAETHNQQIRPDVRKESDGWKDCKAYINGTWVKLDSLRPSETGNEQS
jgi:hypothetical protein